MPNVRALLAALTAGVLLLVGCSDDGSSPAEATAPTTSASGPDGTVPDEEATGTLRILVSNDDGYDAPGIDALTEALAALPDTEVFVVAPAEEQSGQGSNVSDGPVETRAVETARGYPAIAVEGTPADAVTWALEGGLDVTPHLVVSGINSIQNLGALGNELSGTIGAARAGAARGIASLATSTAMSDAVDYDLAATYVVEWVERNRAALLAGELAGDEVVLQNLNVPVCTEGGIRGVVEVPMSTATEGAIVEQDCTSTLEDPADDITAFNAGFVTISDLEVEPAG
jgi:5'-nucleotidase